MRKSLLRLAFVVLWLGLLFDLFVLSPPAPADQGTWVFEVLTGHWAGKDAGIVAVFNLLGVWPLVFAVRLRDELRARPVPAWPFVLASMGVGAFALLPYLILQPTRPVPRPVWRGLRWTGHPAFSVGLAVGALALVAYGLVLGDVDAYIQAIHTRQLVHVMSLDFCVLVGVMGLSFAR